MFVLYIVPGVFCCINREEEGKYNQPPSLGSENGLSFEIDKFHHWLV